MTIANFDVNVVTLRSAARNPGNDSQISVKFGVKRTFRDIVRMFSANGCMPAAFIPCCLRVDTVQEFRDAQPANCILNQAGRVSDEACITLAAIKTLNAKFDGDRKLWNLVEKKARKFVSNAAGLDKETIQATIDAMDM